MIEIINKNIFEAPIDGLAHQTNCHGIWGAGIAKEIKKRFPRAFAIDNLTLVHEKRKLGTFNYAAPADDQKIWVFNLAGQFDYGKQKQQTDYDALYLALESLKNFLEKMEFEKFTLGIPHGMGAGLGGGDFEIILGMIKYLFQDDEKITVLVCKI